MRKLHALHGRDHRLDGADPIPDPSWVYVGTYPGDPNTTVDSPPFKNSWANLGGNYPPLRYKKDIAGFVCLEGAIDGGADGTVVFTLPTEHRPEHSLRFVGALATGSDFLTIQVDPTGDVIVVATGYNPGSATFDPSKINTESDPNGYVLTIVGGVATWAAPGTTTAANVTVQVSGSAIGTESKIDFLPSSVVTVTGADDSGNNRVKVTLGLTSGNEGQVLMTVSGVPTWHDPTSLTPPTPETTVQVNDSTIGTEGTLDLKATAPLELSGSDDVTDGKIIVTASLEAGAAGQFLQTVGGAPVWADFAVKKNIVLTWFGSLPASVPTVSQILRVPYLNGVALTFDLNRLTLRVETPGSSSTGITLQKSPAGGGFIPTGIGSATVASSVHEDAETAGLGTVTSGDIVRVDFTAVGAGAASYTVEMEAQEV